MYCIKCGNRIGDHDKFCRSCGTTTSEMLKEGDAVLEMAASEGKEETREPFKITETEIGGNVHYYLNQFEKIKAGEKGNFNWAAFLCGPFHAVYRGMIDIAFYGFVLPVCLSFLAAFIMLDSMLSMDVSYMMVGLGIQIVAIVWYVAASIIDGLKFNEAYYKAFSALAEDKKRSLMASGKKAACYTMGLICCFVIGSMGLLYYGFGDIWNSGASNIGFAVEGANLNFAEDGNAIDEAGEKEVPLLQKYPIGMDANELYRELAPQKPGISEMGNWYGGAPDIYTDKFFFFFQPCSSEGELALDSKVTSIMVDASAHVEILPGLWSDMAASEIAGLANQYYMECEISAADDEMYFYITVYYPGVYIRYEWSEEDDPSVSSSYEVFIRKDDSGISNQKPIGVLKNYKYNLKLYKGAIMRLSDKEAVQIVEEEYGCYAIVTSTTDSRFVLDCFLTAYTDEYGHVQYGAYFGSVYVDRSTGSITEIPGFELS